MTSRSTKSSPKVTSRFPIVSGVISEFITCVKFTEPISARVSPVVAETVHTDGTRVLQYQSDDQKSIKMTEGQMPMDYLETLEPRLPRGFLDLAEEASNVKVESG